jgi:hypothetical protein
VMHSAPSEPRSIAVGPCAEGGECVYWTNIGPLRDFGTGLEQSVRGAGTIGRAKVSGSGAELVEPEFITGASTPTAVAVDSEHIFWANSGGGDPVTESGGYGAVISRATLDRNTINREFVFPIGPFSAVVPTALALTDTSIYVGLLEDGVNQNGNIRRLPLEGGNAEANLGIGSTSIGGLATEGANVYWTAPGKEAIGRIPTGFTSGGCKADPSCDGEYLKAEGELGGLATSGEHLYWASNG